MAISLVPVPKRPEVGPSHAAAKAYGAFYTDAQIAEFLARWGIRDSNETVFDPSFGGGVFLRADSSLELLTEIDSLLRTGKDEEAQEVADKAIHREKLNLTKADCAILNEAQASLQKRRAP